MGLRGMKAGHQRAVVGLGHQLADPADAVNRVAAETDDGQDQAQRSEQELRAYGHELVSSPRGLPPTAIDEFLANVADDLPDLLIRQGPAEGRHRGELLAIYGRDPALPNEAGHELIGEPVHEKRIPVVARSRLNVTDELAGGQAARIRHLPIAAPGRSMAGDTVLFERLLGLRRAKPASPHGALEGHKLLDLVVIDLVIEGRHADALVASALAFALDHVHLAELRDVEEILVREPGHVVPVREHLGAGHLAQPARPLPVALLPVAYGTVRRIYGGAPFQVDLNGDLGVGRGGQSQESPHSRQADLPSVHGGATFLT